MSHHVEGFTLRVLISGLSAFVPRSDGKKMWVLLPNEAEPLGDAAGIPPHRAVLCFSPGNVKSSEEIGSSVGYLRSFWYLDQVDLEFRPGGHPIEIDNLEIRHFDSKNGSCAHGTAAPEDCFSWVAPIEDACAKRGFSGGGTLDPAFRGDFSDMVPMDRRRILACRLKLNDGVVSSERLGRLRGQRIVWRLRPFAGEPSPSDHSQVLASQVAFELPVKAEYLDVVAREFGRGGEKYLRLVPKGAEKVVRIDIMNEEGSQILGMREGPQLEVGTARVQDRVFEAFGKLAVAPPPRIRMPIPVPEYVNSFDPEDPVAAAAPPCSPGRFASFEE